MKRDPVCNMECREDEAVTAECGGEIFYFCSKGCRDKFLRERECRTERFFYDLIIMGGGPAGLTAAIYASTMKINALLVAKDLGGQAIDSTKVENYMGFDFITGPELIDKFRLQLLHTRYIDHVITEAEKIGSSETGFTVTTADLKTYTGRALIVCTGMTRRRLNIPGEEEYQRRGIFYGNIQDLSFVHGRDVAVIGGGNSALQIVENLEEVANRIHIISDYPLSADPVIVDRVKKSPKVLVYEEYKPVKFSGGSVLESISARKKAGSEIIEIPVGGAFIAIGLHPNSNLVSHLLSLNDKGEIIIGPDCSTSHPGIFAAGDVTNAFGKRIVIACGEGAKAVMAARQYLLEMKRQVIGAEVR